MFSKRGFHIFLLCWEPCSTYLLCGGHCSTVLYPLRVILLRPTSCFTENWNTYQPQHVILYVSITLTFVSLHHHILYSKFKVLLVVWMLLPCIHCSHVWLFTFSPSIVIYSTPAMLPPLPDKLPFGFSVIASMYSVVYCPQQYICSILKCWHNAWEISAACLLCMTAYQTDLVK